MFEQHNLRALHVPGGNEILSVVAKKHAAPEIVAHGLYSFYSNERSTAFLAKELGKNRSTMYRWIQKWETHRTTGRLASSARSSKFTEQYRSWIVGHFARFPLTYIDEACAAFHARFCFRISPSYLWTIGSEAGLTWKARVFYAGIWF